MFGKRKSKRRGSAKAKSSSKHKPGSSAPQLWDLSQHHVNALLRTLPVFLSKLEKDGIGEELLFIRRPSVDGSAQMDETVVDRYEEFVLLQKAVQEYFAAEKKDEVLNTYGCHTWANVVKAILKAQSPQKLLSEQAAQEILNLAHVSSEKDKIEAAKAVLERLPHAQYKVLSDLCRLLQSCASPNDKLAFVFGPILLLVEREEAKEANKGGSQRALKVAEACADTMGLLVEKADLIFPAVTTASQAAEEVKAEDSGSGEENGVAEDEVVLGSVRVLYDYSPVEVDELALFADEWVDVLSRVNEDWLEGKYIDAEGEEHRGIFPQSYCDMSTYETLGVGDHDEIVSLDEDSEDENEPGSDKVIALFPYEPQEDVELALEAGQRLTLVDSSDPDWWKGRAEDGKIGLFPKEYVRRLNSSEDETTSQRSENGSAPAEDRDIPSSESTKPNETATNQSDIHGGDPVQPAVSTESVEEAKPTKSEPPPVPPGRKKRRAKRRPPPPPKPPHKLVEPVNGHVSSPQTGMPPNHAPSSASALRRLQERPLLHSPHAPVARSAIPANRPAPVVRGSVSRASSDAEQLTMGSAPKAPSQGAVALSMGAMNQPQSESTEWRIDQSRFNLCVEWFKKLAKINARGEARVSGRDVAEFILKSGLDKGVVARILELSDMDRDKEFDRDEFVVAHHLAICIRNGMPEPVQLPAYLVPPSKRQYVLN